MVTVLEVQDRRVVVLSSFSSNLLGINLPLPSPPPPPSEPGVEAQQLRTCVRTLESEGRQTFVTQTPLRPSVGHRALALRGTLTYLHALSRATYYSLPHCAYTTTLVRLKEILIPVRHDGR